MVMLGIRHWKYLLAFSLILPFAMHYFFILLLPYHPAGGCPMDMMDQITQGITLAFTFKAIAMVFISVTAGIAIGAIPGVSGLMVTAVLVPFSFFMPPTEGIPFLLGVHKGALFGDSIPAILINTPGQPAAAACSAVRLKKWPSSKPVI